MRVCRQQMANPLFLVKEYHRLCRWFQKALAMHSPAAAESLPLMREVAKIYLIFDGGRETSRENSLPQSFASQNPAPSSEGAFGAHITASAVVGQNTQAKENSMSL